MLKDKTLYKKIGGAVIIVIAMVFVFMSAVFFITAPTKAFAAETVGSDGNPTIVANSQDLIALSEVVNSGTDTAGEKYLLTSDIILNEFSPIGTDINPFKGHFDGDGHTITINGFYRANGDYSNSGLFGVTSVNSVIDNIKIDGLVYGNSYLGGLVGKNLGTINNCVNFAAINALSDTDSAIGGIAGSNLGSINSCLNKGEITANKSVGGIVGYNKQESIYKGTINGAVNLGNIGSLSDTSNRVGGLAGQNDGIIINAYNYAYISNTGARIGSVIGYLSALAPMSDCKNVYNNNSKCNLALVGYSAQSGSLPSSFKTYGQYDFLGNENIVFDNGIMTVTPFDTGYGYMPILTAFAENDEIVKLVRQSIFSSGNGSKDLPFIIGSTEQYNLFAANTLLCDYDDYYIKLQTNINTDKILASNEVRFKGYFDGNEKIINITVNEANNDGLGVFSYADGAEIENLKISGFVNGRDKVGSLCGYALHSTIKNISNSAAVNGSISVGAVIGYAESSVIYNVTNNAKVYGVNNVGGIVGELNNCTVSVLKNYGQVSGSSTIYGNNFGGITGYGIFNADISMLYNSGLIDAPKSSNTGGIFGMCQISQDITCSQSLNTGDINAYGKAGGFLGLLTGNGEIIFSDNAVVAVVTAASYVGGFIGIAENITKADIQNGYFVGNLRKLPKSTIIENTFAVLHNSESVAFGYTNFYYDKDALTNYHVFVSDLIVPNDAQGIAAEPIQLTDINNTEVHSVGIDNMLTTWYISNMSVGFGFLPFPAWLNLQESEMPDKLKYNYFEKGQGTKISPLEISTAQQYFNFIYLYNNYYSSYKNKYYAQVSDITLYDSVKPIGSIEKPFIGHYNGNNKMLYDIYITGNEIAGMFGKTENAEISGICLVAGKIEGENVGGIIGYAANTIVSDCFANIKIIQNSSNYGGGLIGKMDGGSIEGSFFTGTITGSSGVIGGLVGVADNNAEISECFNSGIISGANAYLGGLVGEIKNAQLKYSYCSAYIKPETDNYTGGLAGKSTGSIQNCYYNGIIELVDGYQNVYALVGNIDTAIANFLLNTYYNTDFCNLLGHDKTSIIGNNKTSDEMSNSEFLNAFAEDYYVFKQESDKDSDYAPELACFAESDTDIIKEFSKQSAKIKIYGWDKMSNAEWGTKENPYIIYNREQLDKLSSLTKTYDYSNSYFVLGNDIDMRIDGSKVIFSPIGLYTDAQNFYAFNGHFDGRGYAIQFLEINTFVNYIGFFGYLGEDGIIENLIIDANSSVKSSGSYVGSLVGRNVSTNGYINKIISFAAVSGKNNIGGIVGYTSDNTTVTNVLYDGVIAGNGGEVYGIIGIGANKINGLRSDNSWYIFRYDEENNTNDHIKSRDEGYINNGYTNVLYLDKNGDLDLIFNFNNQNQQFLSFTLLPNSDFYSCFMDVNDNILSEEATEYSTFNTNLTAIYARFTLPLTVNISENADKVQIAKSGNGNYYSGQNVKFDIEFIEYGYFLNIFNAEKQLISDFEFFTFSNTGEKINVEFIMPHSFADISLGKTVTLNISPINDYVIVTAENRIYTKNQNYATASLLESGKGLFRAATFDYYYGAMKTKISDTSYAGIYEVRAKINIAAGILSNDLFLGIVSKEYIVDKAELLTNGSADWEKVVSKDYDGKNQRSNVDVSEYFTGILSEDVGKVAIIADVIWATANKGTEIDVSINNFRLSGGQSQNYKIISTVVERTNGVINEKEIILTLDKSLLYCSYNNMKPSINQTAVSLSSDIGTASISYSFVPVNSDGEIIDVWDNIFNAGDYLITAVIDNNNYKLTLKEIYYITIMPVVIDEIYFMGYENLVYDGRDKSQTVTGSFITINSQPEKVNLKFYLAADKENEIDEIINAGKYIAVPSISNINYILKGNKEGLEFLVRKAVAAAPLLISLEKSEFLVTETPIAIIANRYDGNLRLDKIDLSLRGNAEINNQGIIKFNSYGRIKFRISETNNTNFEDRESDEMEINILPITLYIGLETNNYQYGDIRLFNDIPLLSNDNKFVLVYAYDRELKNIVDSADIEAITKPQLYVLDNTLNAGNRYEVKIIGAESDKFIFAESNYNYIQINKKAIKIIVDGDTANGKIYGNADADISYLVQDFDSKKTIKSLPNGESFGLIGKLSRENGEEVGEYTINQGTLTNKANSNYAITYDFIGKYYISKRELKIVVPTQSKFYLDTEPNYVLQTALDYDFVGNDGFDCISVNITRNRGEDIGSYDFRIEGYDGGANYEITGVSIVGKFVINKGLPILSVNSDNATSWGTRVGDSGVVCTAYYKNQKVEGDFFWNLPNDLITDYNFAASMSFKPNDDNLAEVQNFEVRFGNVIKRKLDLGIKGQISFVYSGEEVSIENINAYANNAVDGYAPEIELSFDKGVDVKDVGEYTIYPILKNNTDKYELKANYYWSVKITPATITVSAENVTALLGEEVTTKFSYVGFVSGEDESVLAQQAMLKESFDQTGYYTVYPSGAESKNYNFNYMPFSVTIKTNQIIKDNLILKGDINPGVSVDIITQSIDSLEVKQAAKIIDKALEVSLFKPNNKYLAEYYRIEISGNLDKNTIYEISFNNEINADTSLYVLDNNGEVIEITSYEHKDGKIIFKSGNISSVCLYENREAVSYILEYLPYVGGLIGVVLVATLIIFFIHKHHKKETKMRKKYLKK